ncbi:EAL domain-containing protein [Agrobacterium sp. ES01]|uniref:EAL domain-containing protein n=1 Tax=Agrobacterium sp. ES01 TaxID=3420714 RepID=UPI003D0C45B0
MTHSVENRFFAIIATAVFIMVVPLFALFLTLSTERSTRELENNITILTEANAQALAKPIWDFDEESVRRIAGTVLSDAAVHKILVRDEVGNIQVAMPVFPTWPDNSLTQKTQAIVYETVDGPKTVGSLTVYYQRQDFFSSFEQGEGYIISIFLVAVIAVIGAAVLGNRLMIVKPLLKLTAAIEATRQLGSRHHVDWQSNDEIGLLANSFNSMQIKLEQEERELKLAHRRATEIYNMTPAMLFSTDEEDRIIGVSDYWLLATGYERADILGTHFADMVPAGHLDHYLLRKSQREENSLVWECTTKFVCADGRVLDVLIVESSKKAEDADQPLALSVMTDITALKHSEARNHKQAITDHLTGWMNRQGFEAALDVKIREADQANLQLACLFIDLDRFKWINDNLGHQAGDIVLRRVATLITPQLPPGSIGARLGGDEFAILVLSANAEMDALRLSESICAIFEKPFVVSGTTARLSASIGVAIYPEHAANAEELLQKSDLAMYSKKHDGKNGAQLYDPRFQDNTRQRAEIEQSIELGLANDWFQAYLQPIVDLSDGTVIGYESLMRLDHPDKGLLPPYDIITVAEENGSIIRIGTCIFEKAVDNLVKLSAATGDHSTYLAINYSPLQFEPDLPLRLAAILSRNDICPTRIVIEITEAMLLHDNPVVHTTLDEFKRLGCRIALDDFGTGYSSLSYLNRFPVDIIKIDQSFIRSLIEGDPAKRKKSHILAEGITDMARRMGCSVVAEGIETGEQWEIVRDFGAEYGQGYLFAKPQSLDDLLERHMWLTEKSAETA